MGKVRRLFRLRPSSGGDAERELREEIESHIELRVADQVRRGVGEREAREEALRRFGDLETTWADLRASVHRRERRLRSRELLDGLIRSLRMAFRQARRAPGYVTLSVLTLSLGVGLTTAAYTVIDRVLLRPLPYVQSDRLVRLYSQREGDTTTRISVSEENWLDWRDRSTTLAGSALYGSGTVSVGTETGARRVPMVQVTGDFFGVLRSPMLLGRGFTEAEAQAEERLAVVGETFWRSQLGGSTELPIEVRLDGRVWQVVGVLPAAQSYPAGSDLWLPRRWERQPIGAARNWINYSVVARLSPGATQEQASADLDRIADGIRAEWPDGLYSWGVFVVPLREAVAGRVRDELDPLAWAAAFVLLIACANVAGMSLARTLSRGQEVAVHVALGAGRGRVVRQLVSEHVYLGLAGGAGGAFIAWATTRLLSTHVSDLAPRAAEIRPDMPILLFGLALSILAGLLAGAIPAWKASGVSVRAALAGARGAQTSGRNRTSSALVAIEVAVAIALLASCGLLIRSFRSLLSRDLGFRVEHVVAADAVLATPAYSDEGWEQRRTAYWENAMARARAVQGVRAVAVGNWVPTGSGGTGFIRIPGNDDPAASAGYRAVSAAYFEVLGIPLLAGRAFDERDRAGTERVTVINQAMADEYWPGQNPLGRVVHATSMESYFGDAPALTVVGVVGNVRHFGYDDPPRPEMFTVYSQVPWMAGSMTLLAWAPGEDAGETALRMQRPLAGADPDVAVDIATFAERVGDWVRNRRFLMTVLTALAAIALVLAGIGIYGLLSFVVAQRTREMGIRAALGASRIGIIGLMLSRAAMLFVAGSIMGLLLAFWMTRAIGSLLVDIAPTDIVTWATTLATLGVCCAAAAFVPAWRAARTDPLVALRAE